MAPETESEPIKFTEFEMAALSLLQSIDRRLKSIDATAEYFYDVHRQMVQATRPLRP